MPGEKWDEIASLLEKTFLCHGGSPLSDSERGEAMDRLLLLIRETGDAWPRDARATFLAALVRATSEGEEHEARRAMLRSLHELDPPPDWAIDLAGRFSHMLGFERAGADLGELAFAAGRSPRPSLTVFLPQLYLKASPPVANPKRAEELCAQLLAAKAPGTELDYPASWMLLIHEADARVGVGDGDAGSKFLEQAAACAPEGMRHSLHEEAVFMRSGGASKDIMGRSIQLNFATTRFLRVMARSDELASDPNREAEVAGELVKIARSEPGAERAALAYVRAGRILLRPGHEGARGPLEAAARLSLAAPDTRALVCRTLARALLAEGADPGRAEALALEAGERPAASDDPRTKGELADAWLLAARARWKRGDAAGAQAALDRARGLDACDKRELDAMGRLLEGGPK